MITLRQLADLFISDVSGGKVSKDSTVSQQEVIKKIRSFIHALLKPVMYEKWAEGDKSAISQAIYSYELSLLADAEGNYVAIPDFYMALPDGRGIHRVYIKGNRYSDFIIQHNPGISGNLPHASMKGFQFGSIEGMKFRINKGSSAKKADKIIMQIINIAPDALADDAALPLMGEQVPELMRLLKQDYAAFAGITTDYLNNANTNIR